MYLSDSDRPTSRVAADRQAAPAPHASVPTTTQELRARARRLLADCLAASATDLYVFDEINYLIVEMASVTEGVLRLMPADAPALADELGDAHRALICFIEDVERADDEAHARSELAARRSDAELVRLVRRHLGIGVERVCGQRRRRRNASVAGHHRRGPAGSGRRRGV